MASSTKEELAQMIAQLEDSGQNAGVCIMAEMKKDRSPLEQMKRRAQEAEGELSILKGIESNRVKELEKRIRELMDRVETLEKDLGKRIVTG